MDHNSLRTWIAVLLLSMVGLSLTACDDFEGRRDAYFAKGKELFEAGDDARAQLELKNTLQIDKKHAEAWYLLGRIEERKGEFQKAFANYSRAVELSPGLIEARVRKAQIQVAGGDLDGADEEIKQILAQSSDNNDALVARAALHKRRGDLDEAEADAREVLGRDPTNVAASAVLASVLIERKAMDEAEQVLKAAVAAHPKEVALQLMLGNLYNTRGNPEGAIRMLKALVEQHPEELGYRERLADYYFSLQRNDEGEAVLRASLDAAPDDLARQRTLLRFLARVRGVDVAQTELAAMLQRQPDAVELRFLQAELLRATKDSAAAEEVYKQIIEKAGGAGPDAIKARNALAQLLIAEKRDDEAAALVQAVLTESETEPDALMLRATLALRKNDAEPAISDLRLVLRDYPDRMQGYRLLGQAHAQRKEYALAEDAFEKAIELAPADPVAYLQLAEVRARSGNSDGALVVLEQLLEKVPDNSAAQQAISRIQLSQRDWGALSQTAKQLKTTRPDHPLGYHLEGLSLQQQGKQVEAIAAFDKGIEIRPEALEPQIAAARSELALKRFEDAEQRVLEVLKKRPDNVLARNLLGEIYVASGEIEKAKEQFEYAVTSRPKSPRAYMRLSQLQAAQGDMAAARKTLETGVDETGRSGILVLQLATLLDGLGERDAAIADYEDVIERFPSSALAANNLAMLLASHVGDPPALARALELAQPLGDSDVPEFLDTLGWVHYLRGEYASALPYLEKAATAKPDVAGLRYHLGMNLLKLGRLEGAREHLAFAAGVEGFEAREEARRALSDL